LIPNDIIKTFEYFIEGISLGKFSGLQSNTKEIFHFNDQNIKSFPLVRTTK